MAVADRGAYSTGAASPAFHQRHSESNMIMRAEQSATGVYNAAARSTAVLQPVLGALVSRHIQIRRTRHCSGRLDQRHGLEILILCRLSGLRGGRAAVRLADADRGQVSQQHIGLDLHKVRVSHVSACVRDGTANVTQTDCRARRCMRGSWRR